MVYCLLYVKGIRVWVRINFIGSILSFSLIYLPLIYQQILIIILFLLISDLLYAMKLALRSYSIREKSNKYDDRSSTNLDNTSTNLYRMKVAKNLSRRQRGGTITKPRL